MHFTSPSSSSLSCCQFKSAAPVRAMMFIFNWLGKKAAEARNQAFIRRFSRLRPTALATFLLIVIPTAGAWASGRSKALKCLLFTLRRHLENSTYSRWDVIQRIMAHALRVFLPLARRRLNIFLPDLLAMRIRKPCVFLRARLEGW